MWKKRIPDHSAPDVDYGTNDYKALLRYITHLANHKLGYPVSLLTFAGIVNNQVLGIKQGSIANILLNNVGDPFKDSETSLLEVKKHERAVLEYMAKFFGMQTEQLRGYVTTGGTEGNFAGLWWTKRYMINSALNELIKNDDLIKTKTKEVQAATAALTKISMTAYKERMEVMQTILDLNESIAQIKNIVNQLLTPTVFFTQKHTHYSIPKIAEILHLNVRPIESTTDGSMDLANFHKEIILHRSAHPHSAIIVIANVGTTITGAVDPVLGIKKILDSLQPAPLHSIHLDGALTGFVMPVLKPFGEVKNYFDAIGVNTIAFSAHKYPGLSQPCGVMLAKREFFDKAFEKSERSVEYVGNISDVTITGSRSGLNVLMLYHALVTLGLDKGIDKLTELVAENIKTARYLYEQLTKIYGLDNVYYPYHFNVMFPRPSKPLAKKYQLMLTGEQATICVLPNVTRRLIDQFIIDLKIEKELAMTNTTTKTDYTIVTMDETHAKSTIDLFTRCFVESEPITKHLNISHADYEPFVREVILKAIKDGMSKVAVDRNQRVVAVAIAEDLADPFIPHLAHYPKLKPVFALIEALSKPFIEGRRFYKNKVAHVWIAAVDPAYRGLGLSTQIDMACVEMAARKGYDYAYAEFTNAISENVTHQFKTLKLYNKIDYDDFVLEGKSKPFAGVKGAAASYLATIRPGVNLDSLANCYKVTQSEGMQ